MFAQKIKQICRTFNGHHCERPSSPVQPACPQNGGKSLYSTGQRARSDAAHADVGEEARVEGVGPRPALAPVRAAHAPWQAEGHHTFRPQAVTTECGASSRSSSSRRKVPPAVGTGFYVTPCLSGEATLAAWIALFRVLRGKAMGPFGDRAASVNSSEY